MAAGTTLKMTFETSSGSATFSFAHAKPSTTKASVQNLGSVMISNGAIYQKQPLLLKSAKLVTTTESEYDLTT